MKRSKIIFLLLLSLLFSNSKNEQEKASAKKLLPELKILLARVEKDKKILLKNEKIYSKLSNAIRINKFNHTLLKGDEYNVFTKFKSLFIQESRMHNECDFWLNSSKNIYRCSFYMGGRKLKNNYFSNFIIEYTPEAKNGVQTVNVLDKYKIEDYWILYEQILD